MNKGPKPRVYLVERMLERIRYGKDGSVPNGTGDSGGTDRAVEEPRHAGYACGGNEVWIRAVNVIYAGKRRVLRHGSQVRHESAKCAGSRSVPGNHGWSVGA